MQNNDLFVKGILDDWSPTENSEAPIATARTSEKKVEVKRNVIAAPNPPEQSKHAFQKAQPMLRFSLVFINFTFIVASMLLIMAGIVARENSAVRLCGHCADLTNVSIVFGVILWMFALFGFNWIRQRSILFLLVYVAFLLILAIAIMAVIIAAGVFDSQIRDSLDSESDYEAFLIQWKSSVANNDTSICNLEAQLNCSGFALGCCGPGCWNVSNPPKWVDEICPTYCGFPQADRQCTESVYNTVRRNLGGFLVISCFSMLLILTGIVMAVLSRKVNQLLEPPPKESES